MKTILYQTGRQYSSEHGQRLVITFDAPMAYFIDLDRCSLQGFVWVVGSDMWSPSSYDIAKEVMSCYDARDWSTLSFQYERDPGHYGVTGELMQNLRSAAREASENLELLNRFKSMPAGSPWSVPEARKHPQVVIIHAHEQTPPDKVVVKDFNSGQVISRLVSDCVGDTPNERLFYTALSLAETLQAQSGEHRAIRYLGTAPDNYEGSTQFVFSI